MGISALLNMNPAIIKRIYSPQSRNGKYQLIGAQKQIEIDKLDIDFAKGRISQDEYEKQKRQLENAPISFYTNEVNGEKNPSENSVQSKATNPFEIGRKQAEQSLLKLEQQYENGEISEFEYKANKYLMTAEANNPTPPSAVFSTTA